jgi:hypothetical protein
MTTNQEYRARVNRVRSTQQTNEPRVLVAYTAKDKIHAAMAKKENAAAYWAGSALACALVEAVNR